MFNKVQVRARINDEDVEFLCEPRQSLLEVLRDTLLLTGMKAATTAIAGHAV